MKNKRLILFCATLFLITGCAPLGRSTSSTGPQVFSYPGGSNAPIITDFRAPLPTDYKIGIDDLLEVNIWQHPDLSREVIVRPDGKISYLLIGDVQVAGLTVSGLVEVLKRKFEDYASELQLKERTVRPIVKTEYLIGVGDALDISVWKIPDLSAKTIVRPDGKISFPLIDDVQAYGKTLVELDEELTDRLSKYVRDPQVSIMLVTIGEEEKKKVTFISGFISTFLEERPEVSVIVKRFGSRRVTVLGEVNSPGIFEILGNAKLLDAIGYARDFTDVAVKDNVFIIRGDITANPEIIKINAWSIIKEGNLNNNIPLQNQDIIYVPRSVIGNINVFWSNILPILSGIQGSITLREAVKATWRR